MAFNFFAKNVYDEDLCFIRDLIEVGSAIADVTSIPVMRNIINGIIDRHGLKGKLMEYTENGHYRVQDCYPTDRNKRFKRAGDLLSAANCLSISEEEKGHIKYKAVCCTKRMGFNYDEKVNLIKKYLIQPTGNKDIDDILIQSYLDIL